uniref:Protein phosphatase 2c n=1 Tax=Rhizophora mucronata TaxID=61149 RepID=A0A2P2LMY2_RHIMU
MGNNTSRVVGCFMPSNGKNGVDLEFLDPLDEGLGHSFCYVRPSIFDSPAITPSNSERFTVDSSTLDSETFSGSFRHDTVDDPSALHRSKNVPETTFKTISGASVSANVKTARTGNQSALFASDVQEPAASFESTSSFAAIPLQPVPRGSGPLNGFMSGPLEKVFASGPLDKSSGFMSGPIEKGVMSGPLDATDKSNFSAPLARGHRKPSLQSLVRSVSGPMKTTLSHTFSKHSIRLGWLQKIFFNPVTQLAWQAKEPKFHQEASRNCLEGGSSEGEYMSSRNLQWAHGKAGEDRVHVVVSEEHGWLFIGIYDGFSGPDATDFLMSHLYRAIDKELEGLLWDYEDSLATALMKHDLSRSKSTLADSECRNGDQPNLRKVASRNLEESCNPVLAEGLYSDSENEIVEESDHVRGSQQQPANCQKPDISGAASVLIPTANLTGQRKRSLRLYELLQMESCDEVGSATDSVVEKQSKNFYCQPRSDISDSRENLQELLGSTSLDNHNGDDSNHQGNDASTSGEDRGIVPESINQGDIKDLPILQRQSSGKSMSSKIKKICRKQKSLRKKLFPWSYDWHREETCSDEKVVESLGPIRRHKSGSVDHDAVLRAMARALALTEEAYMELVEKDFKSPELALMGSCVLVMLMKDQDVYIMNLGDSRAILAQERSNDRHLNQSFAKDDLRYRNRSRELLVRMELDRISEESPMHNLSSRVHMINKNREIANCRLKMRAVQLSTDHSTSIEEVPFSNVSV